MAVRMLVKILKSIANGKSMNKFMNENVQKHIVPDLHFVKVWVNKNRDEEYR